MSYAFPPDLQSLFQEQMVAGNYQTADDLLRDALHALSQQRELIVEDDDPETIEAIRRGLTDIAAGDKRPFSEFDAALRAKRPYLNDA
jgi:Arc/MetJ-type ribon-helix-helix transcriptional regulator